MNRIQDTTLYGKEGTGIRHGSVRQIGLRSLAPGRAQKTADQSYTIAGRISGVDARDAGVLNRGKFGFDGGNYNREKGYTNIRDNIRDRGGEDNRPEDDSLGPRGDGNVAVYRGFQNGFGNRGGLNKAVGLGRAGAIRGPRSTVFGNRAPQRLGRYGNGPVIKRGFGGYGGPIGYGRGFGSYGGYGRTYGGPSYSKFGSNPHIQDISTHQKKW